MNEVTEDRPDGNGTSEDNTQVNKSDISMSYKLGRAFVILVILTFTGFALKVMINLMWPPN